MALLLNRGDVATLVTMSEAIDEIEAAFGELAAGRVAMPQRTVIRLDDRRATHLSMPAALLGGSGALTVKIVTTFPGNAARGIPAVQGLVLVHDAGTGSVQAVLDAGWLTALRTGATSGVATRHLARAGARRVGLLGAGVQAQQQLAAVCAVRSIESCAIYDLQPAAAERCGRIAADRLGLRAEVVTSARAAVEGADVVVVATSSPVPVLEGRWLEAGQHVNVIGAHTPETREVDTTAIVRSRVVPDARDACLAEAGDLLIPIREGAITPDHVGPGLDQVVAGGAPGRERDDQITLFKSVGLAVEDLAVAGLAYRKAAAAGLGASFEFGAS